MRVIRSMSILSGILLLLVCATRHAEAYIKFGARVGDRVVSVRWGSLPVRYSVTDRGVEGVSAEQLRVALERAFRTWEAVDTSDISFQFVGFTSARPQEEDSRTVLGFHDRPDLNRTLGQTSFLINRMTGEILESDIFFNTVFPWSVASGGESGRFDLESVAVHEIGHLVGLGHSAIGETELRPEGGRRVIAAGSVMFPIAFTAGNIADRELKPDDVAGVSDLYPSSDFRGRTGSISGRVTRSGAAVFGAHITVFNLGTGHLVGGFSIESNGGFTIAGLAPGAYVVRVEPLDDGDLESFFTEPAQVDLDFRVSYYERVAVAPRGGGTERFEVQVTPK